MNYTLYYAALFSLWPVVAFAGGQGFTAMLGLAGLPALAVARPAASRLVVLCTVVALVLWIALSELWSPIGGTLISGSIAGGDFAVDAAGLRLGLTAAAGVLTVSALVRLQTPAPAAIDWMAGAILVQATVLLLFALFTDHALAMFDSLSDRDTEAPQNMVRNANAFALALPVLVALLTLRPPVRAGRVILAAAISAAALFCFFSVGAEGALAAPLTALTAALLVRLMPVNGFRVIFAGLGAFVMMAPLFFYGVVSLQAATGVRLPGSFQSRIWGWEAVVEKIWEAPLIGHGLGAAKSWRETYSEHPEKLAMVEPHWAQYPLIPGHPHSMPLHIWAETGLVGAGLATAALVSIGFSLPAPRAVRPDARYAAAGLVGAAVIAFNSSYSAWNEAFWASLALLGGVVIIMARGQASERD